MRKASKETDRIAALDHETKPKQTRRASSRACDEFVQLVEQTMSAVGVKLLDFTCHSISNEPFFIDEQNNRLYVHRSMLFLCCNVRSIVHTYR
jgi:hypothetical protein